MKNLDSASALPKTPKSPAVRTAHGPDHLPPLAGIDSRTQIDLLRNTGPKKTGSALKKILILALVIIAVLAGVALNRAASLTDKIFMGQKTTIFGKVWEVIRGFSGQISLKGENQGQINILLLGIGGPGHEGPYLTDTIILAQIRPQSSEVALISIPRDFLSRLPNNLGERKINAVFAEGYARTKNWQTAGRWATMAVERLSGQTIPYFAVVDFEGFKKAVDEIGGLDIEVEKTFTDATFPDGKGGFLPAITFEKGVQHMDGTRALQFVRSRHGNNGEGSDFARGLRQQKVIKAFKDKVLKLNFLTDADKLNRLLGIFAENFHTNLTPGEISRGYQLVTEHNIQIFLSLNLGLETGLVCPKLHETAGYIVTLCEGTKPDDIQNFFRNAFVLGKLKEEDAVIWLGDSTGNPALLLQTYNRLTAAGLTVWRLNYTKKDDLPQTIIYTVNPKAATLEYLQNILNAKTVSLPPPGVKVDAEKVDVVVILGQNN